MDVWAFPEGFLNPRPEEDGESEQRLRPEGMIYFL